MKKWIVAALVLLFGPIWFVRRQRERNAMYVEVKPEWLVSNREGL